MGIGRFVEPNTQGGVERAFLGFLAICSVAEVIGIALLATGHDWAVGPVVLFGGWPLLTLYLARRNGRTISWTWRRSDRKTPQIH
jgi:hypothetical protein